MMSPGAITDVAGLSVGHATSDWRPTGCSVVLCPQGAVCGVAVRGGSPGTRETELLRPENTVDRVHAVLLTGGSAYGLDAAGGVMRWLDEQGHGFLIGPDAPHPISGRPVRVPIVPAAVLYDLWLGDPRVRPDPALGHVASVAASTQPPAQGNVGAGSGATVGKLYGLQRAMKGGIGTASLRLGRCTVGALVAVNALGDVIDEHGQVIAGARTEGGTQLQHATASVIDGLGPAGMMAGLSTTIGVVATDAVLNKAQATQLASLAHHGLSRAINPVTMHDGDALFALSTGVDGITADLNALGVLAAEVVARAIRNAVWAAQGLSLPGGGHLPAARDFAATPAPSR